MSDLRTPDRAIAEEALSKGLFACCALGAVSSSLISPSQLVGSRDGEGSNPLRHDDLFDTASLTKTVVTASLALLALQEGATALDEPIAERLPELATSHRGSVRLRHLLTHTLDFRFSMAALKELPPQEILDAVLQRQFEFAPGEGYLYCNATSLLLGLWLEKLWGARLDSLAKEKVFQPLGMNAATFSPLEKRSIDGVIPTEIDPWRNGAVRGTVHDESAWALRAHGPVGSAGLFLTIGDLQLFAQELLRAYRGEGALFSEKTLQSVDRNWIAHLGGDTALGLERNQSAWMGEHCSNHTIGKTGFTGCSFVVDLRQNLALTLLSNSTWPKRKPREVIDHFRATLANSLFEP